MSFISHTNKFEMIDGFRCYAPELARMNNGFSSESFSMLYNIEKDDFWFRSRNLLIRHLFEKYIGKKGVCV